MTTRSAVVGTAGHIDHGKSALVRALTGVDPDRLAEEKERGITVDLGFAELEAPGGTRLGIVDVPGHEGFVRNMVAGAWGMDVVLLVVAADEGVMPQTREHLAIVQLLGVRRAVGVVTKVDRADPTLTAVAREELEVLLEEWGYGEAPVVETSVKDGTGLDELPRLLESQLEGESAPRTDDLLRLPVDRAFTVHGTGTVVTGTLKGGRPRTGDRAFVRPGPGEIRIRGIQVHGRAVDEAVPGQRVALAITGSRVHPSTVGRGQDIVGVEEWTEVGAVVARARMLPHERARINPGDRVRVHLGTAHAMARAAPLGSEEVGPGEEGWLRLRLEDPVMARVGDRIILRSYSPVSTIGGGQVVERNPPRRSRRSDPYSAWTAILDGTPEESVEGALELAGWSGLPEALVPVESGVPLPRARSVLQEMEGAVRTRSGFVAPRWVREGKQVLREAVLSHHDAAPLDLGMPLEAARRTLPSRAAPGLADALLEEGVRAGEMVFEEDRIRMVSHKPRLTPEGERTRARIRDRVNEAGLEGIALSDLSQGKAPPEGLGPVVRFLEREGEVVVLEGERVVPAAALDAAARKVREELKGARGLGPSDFRSVLPLSRRHLLPVLQHLDRLGVTVRTEGGREVVDPS